MSISLYNIESTTVVCFPYVKVSDAGVYICEVTVSDSTNNPYGSVNVTLTVPSEKTINC